MGTKHIATPGQSPEYIYIYMYNVYVRILKHIHIQYIHIYYNIRIYSSIVYIYIYIILWTCVHVLKHDQALPSNGEEHFDTPSNLGPSYFQTNPCGDMIFSCWMQSRWNPSQLPLNQHIWWAQTWFVCGNPFVPFWSSKILESETSSSCPIFRANRSSKRRQRIVVEASAWLEWGPAGWEGVDQPTWRCLNMGGPKPWVHKNLTMKLNNLDD